MKRNNTLALLLISVVSVLLFWPLFLKGYVPFPGDYLLAWYQPWKADHSIGNVITIAHKAVADDVFRQLYVYKSLFASIIKQHQFPLWNPYNGAGMPFLATMHAGFFTPFNLLFLFLPLWLAWGMYVFFQEILLGIFTYLYLKKISLKTSSALFGTVVLMLSGVIIVRLLYGEYVYTFSCLPLLLYLTEKLKENIQTKCVFFIPFIILFLFISGQPQVILYVLLYYFFYVIMRIQSFKSFLYILVAVLLGIGMAAIQIVPTSELYLQSAITTSSSKFIFLQYLLPIQHLLTIMFPNFFGNQATYNYWGHGDYIETASYLGLIPIFFAFLSLYKIKNKNIIIFNWIIVILTIISTLNWILPKLFFQIPIPILSTGVPSRIFLLTTFSLSILAAIGLNNWIERDIKLKQIYKFLTIFNISILLVWIIVFLLFIKHISCGQGVTILECRQVTFRNVSLEIFVYVVAAICFILGIIKEKYKKILSFFIILIVVIIGFYNAEKFLPFSPKNTLLPSTPLLSFLQKNTNYDRVFGFGDANIKTDFASYFKFYDPQYYDPLYNKRYGELVAFANTGFFQTDLKRSDVEIVNNQQTASDTESRRLRLLNVLGTKYFIYPQTNIRTNNVWNNTHWLVTTNPLSLPRVYFVFSVVTKKQNSEILQELFDENFDMRNTVILEEKNPLFISSPNITAEGTINSYTPNKVIISAKTPQKGILVLTDNFYPGWKAFIDGKSTKIYRANYTFRAIVVPEGKHVVEFSFDSDAFMYGIIISIISLLIYVGFWLYWKKKII